MVKVCERCGHLKKTHKFYTVDEEEYHSCKFVIKPQRFWDLYGHLKKVDCPCYGDIFDEESTLKGDEKID